MQKELEKAKARLESALQHISGGDIYPARDWSWATEASFLRHDIIVMELAVELGCSDFNKVCNALHFYLGEI